MLSTSTLPVTLVYGPIEGIVDAVHPIRPAGSDVSSCLLGAIHITYKLVNQHVPRVTIRKRAAARIGDKPSKRTEHLVVRVRYLPRSSHVGNLVCLILRTTTYQQSNQMLTVFQRLHAGIPHVSSASKNRDEMICILSTPVTLIEEVKLRPEPAPTCPLPVKFTMEEDSHKVEETTRLNPSLHHSIFSYLH